MVHRRPALLAALLPLLLLGGLAAAPARAGDASPWEDEAHVRELFAEACAAAETACGATFTTRPEVRLSTAEDVEKVLAVELGALAADESQQEALGSVLTALSGSLLAKTEPAHDLVHVLPANAKRIAETLAVPALAEEAVLRVVLAHEAVHALDFQRFPRLDEIRTGESSSAEARQAVGAVIEGHAQLVSERIADTWGLSDAWKTYTAAITSNAPDADGPARLLGRIFAAEMEFAYHQGLAFLRAVDEARGREGVEAVLASPPSSTRVVERPVLWLHPEEASPEVDLSVALEPARHAIEEHVGTPGEQRLLETQLRAQLAVLPPEELQRAVDLYEDARVVAGADPEAGVTVIFALLRLKDTGAAKAWIAVERRVGEAKDEQLKSGPIRITESRYAESEREGTTAGLEMEKTVALPSGTQRVLTRVHAFGRHVIEMSVIDADADLVATMDAVLDEIVRTLDEEETPAPEEEETVPAPVR